MGTFVRIIKIVPNPFISLHEPYTNSIEKASGKTKRDGLNCSFKVVQHFIKRKENFVCKVCGNNVSGTGFTNHCPKCLYSLHVDEELPGDRKSKCYGLMEPIRVELEHGEYVIIHKCQNCGKETRNIASERDNIEEIVKLCCGARG